MASPGTVGLGTPMAAMICGLISGVGFILFIASAIYYFVFKRKK
jgi:hypothetical protein